MANDTSFTLEMLQALEKNLALGLLSVEYDGKKTTFQSAAEMRATRAMMRRALGLDTGSGAARFTITHSKGLGPFRSNG
jgi:hypothetical protein